MSVGAKLKRRRRRAVGMCEITALGDFQDCGKDGRPPMKLSVFHPFHQAVISTAGAAVIFGL
jgi:hypothetical protein